MSAIYNTRMVSKLTDLANMLAKHNYRNESTAIRTIIGKIGNWKEGAEWNPENSLSLPDADHVLEDVINKFRITMNEADRREMVAKNPPAPGATKPTEPEAETASSPKIDEAMKELNTAISNLF